MITVPTSNEGAGLAEKVGAGASLSAARVEEEPLGADALGDPREVFGCHVLEGVSVVAHFVVAVAIHQPVRAQTLGLGRLLGRTIAVIGRHQLVESVGTEALLAVLTVAPEPEGTDLQIWKGKRGYYFLSPKEKRSFLFPLA